MKLLLLASQSITKSHKAMDSFYSSVQYSTAMVCVSVCVSVWLDEYITLSGVDVIVSIDCICCN